jgi:hypothetical protein
MLDGHTDEIRNSHGGTMNLIDTALANFEDMIANGGRTIRGIWRSTRNDTTCNCVDGHHEVCSGWIFPMGGPAECACPCHDDDRPTYQAALAKALKVMNHWRINDFVTIDGSDIQWWKITFVDYRAKEVHAIGPTGQLAIAEFDIVNPRID